MTKSKRDVLWAAVELEAEHHDVKLRIERRIVGLNLHWIITAEGNEEEAAINHISAFCAKAGWKIEAG